MLARGLSRTSVAGWRCWAVIKLRGRGLSRIFADGRGLFVAAAGRFVGKNGSERHKEILPSLPVPPVSGW
jgi:hypothetical protein